MASSRDRHEQRRDPTTEPQPPPEPAAPPELRLASAIGNQAFARVARARLVQREDGEGGTAVKKTADELAKEFDAQAAGGKWEDAAKTLVQLPEATIMAKIEGLAALERLWLQEGADKALPAEQAKSIARRISFVEHRPPDAAPHPDQVKVHTPGKEEHKAKVGGGDVSIRTGGETENIGSKAKSTERFSMGYQGPEAEKTRWLQFIWREVEVEHPVKGSFRVDEPITTTGGTYNLTTDPDKPNYNTDTNTKASPFYEAGFINNRTADATTIYDLPSAMQPVVDRQFDGGATKVVSRAHFTSYLVRDMEVLYKVELDVEWEFTKKGPAPPRKQGVKAAGPANALDPEQRKRLIAQFPNFDYFP